MTATGTRRKSRELAMQMLFQADIGKHSAEQVRKTFWNARDEVDAETRGFSEDIFRVATARHEEIDQLIEDLVVRPEPRRRRLLLVGDALEAIPLRQVCEEHG